MTERTAQNTNQETKILSMNERIKKATFAGTIASAAILLFIVIEGSVFEAKLAEGIITTITGCVGAFAFFFFIRFPAAKKEIMEGKKRNSFMKDRMNESMNPTLSYLPGNIFHNSRS
ncbi:MAG: hypothetical protein O3B09_02815 [Proteobacteria bacterium]|nr:hypothetical protein [Pseudomonadota bacterium]